MDTNRQRTTTTICYNGQFWIALVERTRCMGGDAIEEVAVYTFGPEPTSPQIQDFTSRILPHLRFATIATSDAASALRAYTSDQIVHHALQAREGFPPRTSVTTNSALPVREEDRHAARADRREEQERRYQAQRERRKQRHRGK